MLRSNNNKESPLRSTRQVLPALQESLDKPTGKMKRRVPEVLGPQFDLAIGSESIVYDGMRFLPVVDSSRSEQLNESSLRVALSKTGEYQLNPNQPLEMISGMCLFGASGLSGVQANGQEVSLVDPIELRTLSDSPIRSIRAQPQLHISEVESILRTSNMMQLLVDTQQGKAPMNCTFHMPVPEYKLYMLELFQRGVLNREQTLELFKRIELRAAALKNIVRNRVPRKISIGFGSPLEYVEPYLNRLPSFDVLNELVQQNPLLAALMQQNQTSSVSELATLSYQAGYLQVSEFARQNNAGCLAVEIAEERKIFEYAEKTGKQLGQPLNMAALYILSNTITQTGRYGKQALFMHTPTGESPLEGLREVVTNSKQRKGLR